MLSGSYGVSPTRLLAFAWKSSEPDMFGKDARDSGSGGQLRREERVGGPVGEERRVAAWIGASLVIKGDLTSSEDMTLAGQVDGDVTVREHTLVVAPRARIRGNIVARAVVVHGEVLGAITAERRVEVGETGSVDGDITSPRMAVAEGAVLHGRIEVATRASQPS
jgi:cytoskeletal protein CcmA (bactofilin family)